jgi:hypothetical protein
MHGWIHSPHAHTLKALECTKPPWMYRGVRTILAGRHNEMARKVFWCVSSPKHDSCAPFGTANFEVSCKYAKLSHMHAMVHEHNFVSTSHDVLCICMQND